MTPTRRHLEWALIVGAIFLGAWLVWRGTAGVIEGPGSKLDATTSTTLGDDGGPAPEDDALDTQ